MFRKLVLYLTLITGTLEAAPGWVRLSNSQFDLYAQGRPAQAAALFARFEQSAAVLSKVLGIDSGSRPQVRIIAFHSRGEYKPYRIDDEATAYYIRANGRDCIVLSGLGTRDYAKAVHEYVHVLLHRRNPGIPAWLDEGLAEALSAASERDGEVQLGLANEDRLDLLKHGGLKIGLAQLFKINPAEEARAEHGAALQFFYAESWLLAHMLRYQPEYSANFGGCLTLMNRYQPEESVFSRLYRKSTTDVEQDLKSYLHRKQLPVETVKWDLPDREASPRTDPLDSAAQTAMLADLRSALEERRKQL